MPGGLPGHFRIDRRINRMKFSFVENHSISFLKVIKVCSAADAQDGSGLQLETSSLVFWKKTVKTDYGFFLQ